MSLDVYLNLDSSTSKSGSGIFVREDGETKEISRAEWDEKFPDREPIVIEEGSDSQVYQANITHNLNTMAQKANIYEYLWRPEEVGKEKAKELIKPLEKGLELLKDKPNYFKTFNPENGWGDYEGLVRFVENYLEACRKYPEATVSVWR